uniref:Cathepsin propeptide inhibitor domain-containing protein n=1 Tax=Clastoptera arizonana TaxID=38151 RepID=A0A1B6DFU7_9HEMI
MKTLLYPTLVLIIFMKSTNGQNNCNQAYEESVNAKEVYLTKFKEWINKFDKFFYEDRLEESDSENFGDYTYHLKLMSRKYERDFKDIQNAFDVKMQILNTSQNINDIIAREKAKLADFESKRFNLFTTSNYDFPYKLYDASGYYSQGDLLSDKRCGPCDNVALYSSCLNNEVLEIERTYNTIESEFQNFWQEVQTLDQVKRWDFLNNARKAALERSNVLNISISIQQLKDFYTKKSMEVNNFYSSVDEEVFNSYQTSNFISGGRTILDILQFVYNRTLMYPRNSNCDYVTIIKDIIDVINVKISPFKRKPLLPLDGLVNKYGRQTGNTTDIDRLIDIFEDTIKGIILEFRGTTPAYLVDIDTNQNALEITYSISRFNDKVSNGYCSGVNTIKEAGANTFDVFDCFVKVLTKDVPTNNRWERTRKGINYIYGFLTLAKSDITGDLNTCYNKTQQYKNE